MNDLLTRQAARRGFGLTVLLAAVLTVAIAFPVVREPATQLFGPELVGRQHDPFTVMEQYEAGSVPPPYAQPATDLPGIALARWVGGVVAYNGLVLASFVATAALAYVHARHLIGSPAGAAVAALLFALSPFHVAQASYHVHIAQIQWIPLFFLCLWRLLERPGFVRALAAALALLLAGAASLYLGFIVAVTAPAAALAYAASSARVPRPAAALVWAAAMLAGAVAVALTIVGLWAPEVLRNPAAFAFPESAVGPHSARWWSYVLPAAAHPWLGGFSARYAATAGIPEGLVEQQLSIGASVVALAVIALVARRAAHSVPPGPPAIALLVTAAAALLCSLPPVLTLGQWQVPMPSALLHEMAPMFRAYARFGVIPSLMITTLAGAGVAVLLARRSRASVAVAIALVAVAAFEYLPAVAARDTLPTSAHRALAGTRDLRLFDCVTPTPGATSGLAWLMRADVMFPAGLFDDCSEPQFGSKLAVFGFTHIIVRRDSAAGAWLRQGGAIDGAATLRDYADATVFNVVASRPPVYVVELTGFYPREYGGGGSWRWMPLAGTVTLANITASPVTGSLEVELDAFAQERLVTAAAAGHPDMTMAVGTERRWHRIGPLRLEPGTQVLALTADRAVTPQAVLRTSDTRPLSVRLRHWRWMPG